MRISRNSGTRSARRRAIVSLAALSAAWTVADGAPASASTCAPSVATLDDLRTALADGVTCDELVVTVTADITVTGGQLEFVANGALVLQSDGTTRTLSGASQNRILLAGADADQNDRLDTDAGGPLPLLTLRGLRFVDGAPSAADLASWAGDGGRGGGAVYAVRPVVVEDSVFDNNTYNSDNLGGGAAFFENGEVSLIDSEFTNNDSGWTGGAVRVGHTRVARDAPCLHIEGVTVSDNTAVDGGGGIYVQCDNTEGLITVESSDFSRNTSGTGTGGAMFTLSQSVSVTDSLFADNVNGEYGGGALSISSGDSLTVDGSTFVGNSASSQADGQGGAIRTYRPSVVLTNSTFVGNTAGDTGDAILSGTSSGVTELTHVTVVGGDTGAAIQLGGGTNTLTVDASIISDPSGGCAEVASLTANHSVIAADGCSAPTAGSNNWIDGTDGTWDGSWLADIADNGGDTPTVLPSTSQPTVFRRVPVAGDVCADLSGVDQRNEARPGRRGETNCWSGAVEVVVNDPLTITASGHTLIAGDPVPTIVGSLSVDGVTVEDLSCSTTYTVNSPAGTYPTTCSGGSAYRYDITYVDGAVTAVPPETDPLPANSNLEPGDGLVTVDGVEVPVTVSRAGNTVTMTGDGFAMALTGLDEDRSGGVLDADGNLILQAGGFAEVAGSGFAPNSTVSVYLFSTPVLLGTVSTDGVGDFAAVLPIPADTPAGPHTVQANGRTADGQVRSMNLGVVVPAPATTLPATGGNLDLVAPLALLLMVVGLGALAIGSRRRLA